MDTVLNAGGALVQTAEVMHRAAADCLVVAGHDTTDAHELRRIAALLDQTSTFVQDLAVRIEIDASNF